MVPTLRPLHHMLAASPKAGMPTRKGIVPLRRA